jgi:hypothetical protein
MKLESVRVRNFKSIDDSTSFSVSAITCLVGKNEAGKSALLEALYKLHPVIESDAKFEPPIEFYPRRRWSMYKDRHETDPDPILETVWQLDAEDHRVVNEALPGAAYTTTAVTILKGYSNSRTWDVEVDEAKVLSTLLAQSGLFQEESDKLKDLNGVQSAIQLLTAKADKSERETAFLNALKTRFQDKTAGRVAINVLFERLPKFIYFSDYDRLPGQISLTALLQKQAAAPTTLTRQEQIFLALLDLAGTDAKELQSTSKFEELKAELEAIRNTISDEIFEYWSQNRDLRVEFTFDAGRAADPAPFNQGWVFRTRIENMRHRASVPFELRSTGFIWFFSFLVWFSQLRKKYGNNLIILLDEPGLSLHGRAQGDLLRYMVEKLVPHSQVIYTTHSPFMVDADNLLAVRTVEDTTIDGKILGTKVGDRVLSTDADTIFPLQAALGYDITQTLFVGKHPLLVEGPSDLLYLKWFSLQLKLRNRVALDSRWTISPAGGIDKIVSFVTLFGGKKLDIGVLSDFHHGDKKKVEALRQSSLLKAGRVFTAEAYAGPGVTEADIEDLLGRGLYAPLVNSTYGLSGPAAMQTSGGAGASARVVADAQKHVDLIPDAREFDHFEPAAFLVANYADVSSADTLPDLTPALERFEKLFGDLNDLLPK